jgi:hypothetical protein
MRDLAFPVNVYMTPQQKIRQAQLERLDTSFLPIICDLGGIVIKQQLALVHLN